MSLKKKKTQKTKNLKLQHIIHVFWWIFEGYVFDGGFLPNSENAIIIDGDLKESFFIPDMEER